MDQLHPVKALWSILNRIHSEGSRAKALGVGGTAGLLAFYALKRYSDSQLRNEVEKGEKKDSNSKKLKAAVNREFFGRFRKFLPVLVPGIFTREALNLAAIAGVLMARTWFDFWIIGNNAQILGTVAKRDFKQFLRAVAEFALMQLPISLVNNMLKYLISTLALNFRERLTVYMHEKYLKGITFYSVSNLDNRIQNADQLLTQDIESFCTSLSNLYSNITKPLVDIVVFFSKLVDRFGWTGPSTMLVYFLMAGAIMTRLRTPFGKYVAIQGKLGGDFRHIHSRLITHSEEVAFYQGNKREHNLLNSRFYRLVNHIKKYYTFRLILGTFDSMITKYSATILGYFIVTSPIFDPKNDARYIPEMGGSLQAIMEDYTRYMRLLATMVRAVGRLVDAGRELSHFAGYTERVAQLNNVLEDLSQGKFQRTMVSENKQIDLTQKKGKLVVQDSDQPIISFQEVPIVTPNGDVLIKSMSFEVKAGMNCLISGPNGCGKSSLFRILGGLWPIYDGTIIRPNEKNLFYVPQKPYLAIGTLRDQVIYPHTLQDFQANGGSDNQLMELMALVKLEYVVEREGGWDSTADWADVLSGGEKQRIAMARLFYHKPQFAILDECTSAVSVDVEGDMYNFCRKTGITLFTVSHRTTLWKFHEFLLKFDGKGHYEFRRIDESEYPN